MRPAKNQDLHGAAPDDARVALLLIDVVNDLEFPGGDALLKAALPMAEQLATLKRRARAADVPAIYVNDNFGRWQSDLARLVRHCLDDGVRGRPVVERLLPADDDYFVLKPKHSGFFSTALDTLLTYLKTEILVLTGLTADSCVLFTAADAHMRDFHVVVPEDCVASLEREDQDRALVHMRRVLSVEVVASTALDFAALATDGRTMPR